MPTIRFKAKAKRVSYVDGAHAFTMVSVPTFDRKHCEMSEWRTDPKYGGFANSDLFPGILRRIRSDVFGEGREYFKLEEIPARVSVDTSGFLAVVSVEV